MICNQWWRLLYKIVQSGQDERCLTRFWGQQLNLLMEEDDVALYLGGEGENEVAAEDMVVVIIIVLVFYFISLTNRRSSGRQFAWNFFCRQHRWQQLRRLSTAATLAVGGSIFFKWGCSLSFRGGFFNEKSAVDEVSQVGTWQRLIVSSLMASGRSSGGCCCWKCWDSGWFRNTFSLPFGFFLELIIFK